MLRGLLQRAVGRVRDWLPAGRGGVASPAFMSSFVALAAKMAKADGVAVPAEAEAFEKFLDATCSETVAMRRIYDLAKQNTAGYELYAKHIGYMLRNEPATRRAVLECLMYVACSDGILHPKEDEFLRVVADAFKIAASSCAISSARLKCWGFRERLRSATSRRGIASWRRRIIPTN